jgi:ABC-type lipoprotein release transport system permease subunit
MKGRQVTTLFLLEGTMIGALGAFIGCLVGAALVWAVAQVGLDMSYASGMGEITALMGERLYPSLSLTQTIGRGLTVTLIAALATLYPAWQASRKQPADVLHHV